jgi:hypothetical protein
MCAALLRHWVGYSIVQWIRPTLEGFLAKVTLNGSVMMAAVSRGCPTGTCVVATAVVPRSSDS